MKYTLTKRKTSTIASDDIDFVSWMRKQDLQKWTSNIDFMKAYAYRKSTFENIILRPDNENVFVEDLIKNNMLTVEENPSISIKNLFKIKTKRS